MPEAETIETTIPITGTPPARVSLRVALAILVCMSAIYFFSFFQRVAVPGTIFDELQSDFHTTAGWITGLSTLYLCVYGVMQLVSGLLNDRFGAARVMLACGVLLSIGSILFPLAPSITWLYAARALVGLGASLAVVSLIKEMHHLFVPQKFPIYLGIALVLGYAGGLVGTYPFEHLVIRWGWRNSLLGAGILCALTLMATVFLFKRTGLLRRRIDAPSPFIFRKIAQNRAAFPLLVTVPTNFAVYFLLQSTLGKKILVDYCHVSAKTATVSTCMMMLSMMSIVLVSGYLTRAIGNRRKPLIIAATLCVVAGYVCLLWGLLCGYGGGWFLFCYMLLALSNLGSPIANIMMIELNPPDAVGIAIGLLNSLCYVLVGLLTLLSGFIMDHFRAGARVTATAIVYPKEAYLAVLVFCACLSLGSLISSFFLCESNTNK